MKNVQICEGVEGMWHYHLCPSDDDTRTKSLCGARTMSSPAVLSSWGFKPEHMPAHYCEECESIEKERAMTHETPRWYTADEIDKHLAEEYRLYVSVDVANWIADGFQKAFDKGSQLYGGQLVTLFRELDMELDGVLLPSSANAIINAIRPLLKELEDDEGK